MMYVSWFKLSNILIRSYVGQTTNFTDSEEDLRFAVANLYSVSDILKHWGSGSRMQCML
jgi:hypothetical protein